MSFTQVGIFNQHYYKSKQLQSNYPSNMISQTKQILNFEKIQSAQLSRTYYVPIQAEVLSTLKIGYVSLKQQHILQDVSKNVYWKVNFFTNINFVHSNFINKVLQQTKEKCNFLGGRLQLLKQFSLYYGFGCNKSLLFCQ